MTCLLGSTESHALGRARQNQAENGISLLLRSHSTNLSPLGSWRPPQTRLSPSKSPSPAWAFLLRKSQSHLLLLGNLLPTPPKSSLHFALSRPTLKKLLQPNLLLPKLRTHLALEATPWRLQLLPLPLMIAFSRTKLPQPQIMTTKLLPLPKMYPLRIQTLPSPLRGPVGLLSLSQPKSSPRRALNPLLALNSPTRLILA
jgi:hypothetical protein